MDATTTDTLPNNNDTLLTLSSDDNDTPMATDKKKTTIDLSDSDNDSDDQGGLTVVDNLNISARLKRLMRDTTLTNALDDDDDSDDDDDPLKDNVLFRTPAAAVNTPAVQSLLRTEPSPRLDKSNKDASSSDEAVKELDVASPDRPRLPFEQFQSSPSPLKNRPLTHRDLNKRLQDMMAKEMLERR